MQRGVVLAVTGDAEAAVPMINAGISQYRSTNSTWLTPWYLTRLAEANAKLGHFDEAWQRIFEAFEEMEKGGEVQHQAEINRVAGEIALMSPEPDAAKAESVFRTRTRRRPPATSKVLGTPRRNEHGASLA